jgi:hypothetical protein
MISHVDPQFSMGHMEIRFGGEIDAYTTHPNFRRWEMLEALQRIKYYGEVLWYAVDRNWIRSAACKTAWPQQLIDKLQLCSKDLTINLILLMRDSSKPFWVCTYGTEYCTWIPWVVQ